MMLTQSNAQKAFEHMAAALDEVRRLELVDRTMAARTALLLIDAQTSLAGQVQQ